MYRPPSARRKKKLGPKLNLIPIMDIVFNLIFFLLFSAQFIHIFEIGGDTPILAEKKVEQEKKDRPPLNLTLEISKQKLILFTGEIPQVYREFSTINYPAKDNLKLLHESLVELKKQNKDENLIYFVPDEDIDYDYLVAVMDQVRDMKTDNGQKSPLFNQIVYGIFHNAEI